MHEWETGKEGKRRLREREGEKADYILKMEEQADQKARAEADKGTEPPKNLITWVFQDDFIPRAKLTEDGSYSIISDYLGTPVEAYDEEGKKVWERELDIYGRVQRSRKDRFGSTTELLCEDGFIPFRYQGQYENAETGLYYNRFRYYSPSDGCYTQVDAIGLAGGNPTVYGYVGNPNSQVDLYRLFGEIVYQLINEKGDVIYYGITSREALIRMAEHSANGKVYASMQILSDNLTHDQARSLEGALIRKRLTANVGNISLQIQLKNNLSNQVY